ncbi:MAG: hypothetical protein PUJ92_00775 [Bacilli bacterium]|nr:hypothetical protein [Bacilli bacterium]MDY5832907.1 hypothetical protein [Candidatus Onthovivens sp.]
MTKEELEDETEEIGSTIITTFSSDEEKEIVFNLIKRHIELMPKVYRKRNSNWIIVSDLTFYGRGYSFSICSALSVDPNGYEWKKEDLEKLESF